MDNSNGIIRVEKHTKNFVILNKLFLEDKRLSFKSKGILTYLLSKPDDWTVRVHDLISSSADGESAVRSALRELEKYGYYKKFPVRTEGGARIDHWESIVYESPKESETEVQQEQDSGDSRTENSADLFGDFQKVGSPKIGFHREGNRRVLNNNITKDRDILSTGFTKKKFNQTSAISSSSKDTAKAVRGRTGTKTTGRATGKSSVGKRYATKVRTIEKQIAYDQFVEEGADMELIDKIVEYLAGYYVSPTVLQRNGVPISETEALEYFNLLDHTMLAELIEKYESIRSKIDVRNERSYILVMLYDILKNPIF